MKWKKNLFFVFIVKIKSNSTIFNLNDFLTLNHTELININECMQSLKKKSVTTDLTNKFTSPYDRKQINMIWFGYEMWMRLTRRKPDHFFSFTSKVIFYWLFFIIISSKFCLVVCIVIYNHRYKLTYHCDIISHKICNFCILESTTSFFYFFFVSN